MLRKDLPADAAMTPTFFCFSSSMMSTYLAPRSLKVHKIENFFDSDFGICVILC